MIPADGTYWQEQLPRQLKKLQESSEDKDYRTVWLFLGEKKDTLNKITIA